MRYFLYEYNYWAQTTAITISIIYKFFNFYLIKICYNVVDAKIEQLSLQRPEKHIEKNVRSAIYQKYHYWIHFHMT